MTYNKKIILIILLCVLLIISGGGKINQTGMSSEKTTIYWFYRDGCPHCDNMKDSWINLKKLKSMENYSLMEMDMTSKKNIDLSISYKVSGVPSIIKVNRSGYKTYNGDRSTLDMEKWILS